MPRHKWKFVKNVVKGSITKNKGTFTTYGKYTCEHCNATQLGVSQPTTK